jgi:hypothetical protein
MTEYRAYSVEYVVQLEEDNAKRLAWVLNCNETIARLRAALQRLSSPEAFCESRAATKEETARMFYAADVVKDLDAAHNPTQEDGQPVVLDDNI